jgi:hypothetical protein
VFAEDGEEMVQDGEYAPETVQDGEMVQNGETMSMSKTS